MDFINQVKKLKDITKSSEVKALCENFLNGGSVSKEQLFESLESHDISIDTTNKVQSHVEAIRNEEIEASKRVAESLMESWGGINNNKSLGNAGAYVSLNESATMTDPKAIEKAYASKPIKKGEKGERVKTLQTYLGVKPVDGIFGPALEAKVKEFQKANKLPADGIVGMATLKKMIEIYAKPKTLPDLFKEIASKFISAVKGITESDIFLEELEKVSSIDKSAGHFLKSNKVNNLGVLESIEDIKRSSIYTYPKTKILCEQYENLILNKRIPEFALVQNFINDIQVLNWDDTVRGISSALKENVESLSREIEVSKVIESIKNSGSQSFYSDLSDILNEWLVSESKSSALLVKNISKWSFNPVVRNLINYINVNESTDNRKLEIPSVAQGESSVSKVFSPVMLGSHKSIFYLGGNVFETNSAEIRKLTGKDIAGLSSDYIQLVESFNKPYVRVNEEGIFVQIGKSTVRIVEEGEETSVYLGKRKLKFSDPSGLAKILGLESATYFGVNETQVVSDIMRLYTNYNNIVELDFAKSINSNVFEGLSINLIKWNNQIYLQRINNAMNENSIYKVTGNQAVSMVKEFMRYDISEGLTEFLVGENRVKSIMVNDRNKVIENISKVEEQINKLDSLMSSNPLYSASTEIMSAKKLLEKELSVLREKWNQINIEISSSEHTLDLERSLEVFEDEKFNIGDFIKVKESGDTGKIISIDATSGRYTVLLDTGKTSDFQIGEITDLEEALSQAAENNADSSEEDDSQEEVKENFGVLSGNGNNLNKSQLSETDQKKLLNNFAKGHGFSKAPGTDNGKVDMKMDSLHGYNSTMNEENADGKKNPSRNFYFAPKAENQNKPGTSFVQSSKGTLSKAPTGKRITEEEDEEGGEKE